MTSIPYATQDIYRSAQISYLLMSGGYERNELPQDVSMSETTSVHAVVESAYDNGDARHSDVPPDVTIEVIDDDPSEDQAARAFAKNVYSKEANEAYVAEGQRGLDSFCQWKIMSGAMEGHTSNVKL